MKPIKDIVYKIISNPKVGSQGFATIKDLLSKGTIEDDNKKMFIYGPESLGRKEIINNKAYAWEKDINDNKYKKVKVYEGILNPYNEYLFNERDRGLVEELQKRNYSFPYAININDEYTDPNTGYIAEGTPYFDDVHGYRIKFSPDGIQSSDLYDFGKNYTKAFAKLGSERSKKSLKRVEPLMELERKALNLIGHPYILSQQNVPIRFVSNPQGSEIQRVNSITNQTLDRLSDEEIANITESGYIEPTVIKATKRIPTGKSGIHIKPENRGKFTKAAKAEGETPLQHARKVMKDPNATTLQRKRANFVINANKWKNK